MQLTRPKIDRVMVTLTDPESRKSRTLTLYGVKRDDLFDRLVKEAEDSGRPSRSVRGKRPTGRAFLASRRDAPVPA